MKKKNLLIPVAGAFAVAVGCLTTSILGAKYNFLSKAETPVNQITIGTGVSLVDDEIISKVAVKNCPTNSHNLIEITCTGVAAAGITTGEANEKSFCTLEQGGTIYNTPKASDNHNRLTGITDLKIAATKGSHFQVDYDWGGDDLYQTTSYKRVSYDVTIPSTGSNYYAVYNFHCFYEKPNFFRVTAVDEGETVIRSIQVDYECSSAVEEGPTNLTLSSPEALKNFRDYVNDQTTLNAPHTFSGKTVELGADIELDNTDFGSPIGCTDTYAFKGTFNGNYHKIKNFNHSSGDAVALFSRCTNATVKNLKLENIITSVTTQRAAAVCARSDGSTFENIEVLSGTISGPKQTGGIVGVIVNSKTTLTNCINRADVTGTSTTAIGGLVGGNANASSLEITSSANYGKVTSAFEGTGGILGYLGAYTSTVVIDGCHNYGEVSGEGNGTGGIYGANPDAKTLTLKILNCVNHGSVKGADNVGGIAGLPRISKADSIIDNCYNAGDVYGTSTMIGGISGRARIDVTNCYCLKTVNLTVSSSTVKLASDCSMIGFPGFITASQENTSSGVKAVVSGSLIDELPA